MVERPKLSQRPSRTPVPPKLRRGFSLVELLVALAVLGILVGMGVVLFRAPSTRVFTNDVRALVQRSRYEAVKRDRPVAIVFDTANQVIESRIATGTSVSDTCSGSQALTTVDAATYRGISFSTTIPTASLVWLPNGRPVNCSGDPDVAGAITIDGGRNAVSLQVSVGGRVTRQ